MYQNDLQIDESFYRNYKCRQLATLPSLSYQGPSLFSYPGASKDCYVEGPIFEFNPNNPESETWIGTFAPALYPKSLTGVYSHPNQNKVLVAASGEAYVVAVDNPIEWEEVRLHPVLGCIAVPKAGIIVLYDFIRLQAFDAKCCRWETRRISWDGLQNVSFDGHAIVGEAWDSPKNMWIPFSVDITNGCVTGCVTGGNNPDLFD